MNSNQIEHFLNSWKEGVIEIGRVYLDGGDYEKKLRMTLLCQFGYKPLEEKVIF